MIVKIFTHTEAKAFLKLACDLNNISLALVRVGATDPSLKNYLTLHNLKLSKTWYFSNKNGKPALDSEIDIIDPEATAILREVINDAWVKKYMPHKRLFNNLKAKLKKYSVFIKVRYEFVSIT